MDDSGTQQQIRRLIMRHRKLIAAGVLGLGIMTLVAVRAQQKTTLTALDYI